MDRTAQTGKPNFIGLNRLGADLNLVEPSVFNRWRNHATFIVNGVLSAISFCMISANAPIEANS